MQSLWKRVQHAPQRRHSWHEGQLRRGLQQPARANLVRRRAGTADIATEARKHFQNLCGRVNKRQSSSFPRYFKKPSFWNHRGICKLRSCRASQFQLKPWEPTPTAKLPSLCNGSGGLHNQGSWRQTQSCGRFLPPPSVGSRKTSKAGELSGMFGIASFGYGMLSAGSP